MPVDIILPPELDTKNTIDDIDENCWYAFTFKGKYTELEGVAILKYEPVADTHILITIDQNDELIIWSNIHEYSDRYEFRFDTNALPANTKFVVTIRD